MNPYRQAPFRDRREAGRRLGEELARSAFHGSPLVLALPRGGVPVAAEVARALEAPLDVLVVRKLGVPGHEEYAMGAIAGGGIRILRKDLIDSLELPRSAVEAVVARESAELARREALYRGGRTHLPVAGRTVIVVDDGIATGSTMRAAVQLLRQQHARHMVVAVPVAPPDTVRDLQAEADEVLALYQPEPFGAVGCFYDDFSQTTDEEVREILDAFAGRDDEPPGDRPDHGPEGNPLRAPACAPRGWR
jgi:putative phosphoribosyl transferase